MSAPKLKNAAWLKLLHQWHWISSAVSLLGMILFAATGITLNHATQIETKPQVTSRHAQLPVKLLQQLQLVAKNADGLPQAKALPPDVAQWMRANWSIDVVDHDVEWSPEEAYVALPRPGGDAWLRVDLSTGAAEYELTDRGWVSWLNDLHKGRHTDRAWSWFIDIFAAACLVFAITGLLILKCHASNRPLTWPMVGLGVLIPALLALPFIH